MFAEYSKGYGPTFFLPAGMGFYLIDPAGATDPPPLIEPKLEADIKNWLTERGLQNAQWNQTFHEINEEGLPMEGHDVSSFYPARDLCEEYYIANWDDIKNETTQILKDEKGDQYDTDT